MILPDDILDALGGQDAIHGWIEATQPPDEEIERFTRGILAAHRAWDSFYSFIAITWDGTHIGTSIAAGIPPTLPAEQYRQVLSTIAIEFLRDRLARDDEGTEPPVIGFALQIEAFGISGEGEPTAEQREALDNRTLRTLPESRETCLVITATADGRVWLGKKIRDGGKEELHGPTEFDSAGGQLAHLVIGCAWMLAPLYLAFTASKAAEAANVDDVAEEPSAEATHG